MIVEGISAHRWRPLPVGEVLCGSVRCHPIVFRCHQHIYRLLLRCAHVVDDWHAWRLRAIALRLSLHFLAIDCGPDFSCNASNNSGCGLYAAIFSMECLGHPTHRYHCSRGNKPTLHFVDAAFLFPEHSKRA